VTVTCVVTVTTAGTVLFRAVNAAATTATAFATGGAGSPGPATAIVAVRIV
jgi:hypothetical protein